MKTRPANLETINALRRLTLADVRERFHTGRLTGRTYTRYMRLWTWGAVRYTGAAALEQEQRLHRLGPDSEHVRMGRVRRLLAAINAG